jgi:8-oxo-dGTP pyrophosphatase MutT (NUDIX family)
VSGPAEPVPAATVLLLRDGPTALETFMVVRHHQIDFASGALVFPGGKVDEGDFEVRDLCDGVGNVDATQRAVMAGAIREAFEECGVLLAREAGAADLVVGSRLAALDGCRHALQSGELSLRQFLDGEGLRLACDRLQHFAHWITPPLVPKRFDTHFYLAAAPTDHLAVHDGHESVDSVWISPRDAIAGSEDGTYTVIFPTLRNLELLGRSPSVDEAMAAAARRDVVAVLPWVEEREDGSYLRIPPEAGYDISEERLPERPGP